jgi:hypothetical protein
MANEEASSVLCPSCKKDNPSNATFCMACGAAIVQKAASTASRVRRLASALGNAGAIGVLQLRSFSCRSVLLVVDWRAGKACAPATDAEREVHARLSKLMQMFTEFDIWPRNEGVPGKLKCATTRMPRKAGLWMKIQFLRLHLGSALRSNSSDSIGGLVQQKLVGFRQRRSALAASTPWLLRQPLVLLCLCTLGSYLAMQSSFFDVRAKRNMTIEGSTHEPARPVEESAHMGSPTVDELTSFIERKLEIYGKVDFAVGRTGDCRLHLFYPLGIEWLYEFSLKDLDPSRAYYVSGGRASFMGLRIHTRGDVFTVKRTDTVNGKRSAPEKYRTVEMVLDDATTADKISLAFIQLASKFEDKESRAPKPKTKSEARAEFERLATKFTTEQVGVPFKLTLDQATGDMRFSNFQFINGSGRSVTLNVKKIDPSEFRWERSEENPSALNISNQDQLTVFFLNQHDAEAAAYALTIICKAYGWKEDLF